MLIFDADCFDRTEGNFEKCQKHGVSIDEIESFFSSDPDVYADPAHSINEQRLRAIGRTSSGRALFVAFTSAHGRRVAADTADKRPVHASEGDSAL